MSTWFDKELPKSCPPANAKDADGVYYRFIESSVISERDFLSHMVLYPHMVFSVGECQARSVSIFPSIEACESVSKLPNLKSKKLATVELTPVDGKVLKTPSKHSKDHLSWWRSNEFHIHQARVTQ